MDADSKQTALAFYNAARAETVERLALREQVLLAYLATSGVIAGIAFKETKSDPNILLLISVLSLPFTLAFLRHDWIINQLSHYVARDLRAILRIQTGADEYVFDWDGSESLRNRIGIYLIVEKLFYAIVICGAAVASLLLSRSLGGAIPWLYVSAGISAALSILVFAVDLIAIFFYKDL